MRSQTNGNFHIDYYDSLGELVDWNETAEDNRSRNMRSEPEWFGGARSMKELIPIARHGLPVEGVKGLRLAETLAQERSLINTSFQTRFDVTGCEVDVARYLSGEPENMIDYWQEDTIKSERVVTLVAGIGVNCMVSADAVRKHGEELMALALAIDATGMVSEVWADVTVKGGNDKVCRQAVKLKACGEEFNANMFMFALTHASMLRGLLINAMHRFPKAWHTEMGIKSSYGYPANASEIPESYPEGAIFIDAIRSDDQAGKQVRPVLKQLGLLADGG
jgi:hypothetical protein